MSVGGVPRVGSRSIPKAINDEVSIDFLKSIFQDKVSKIERSSSYTFEATRSAASSKTEITNRMSLYQRSVDQVNSFGKLSTISLPMLLGAPVAVELTLGEPLGARLASEPLLGWWSLTDEQKRGFFQNAAELERYEGKLKERLKRLNGSVQFQERLERLKNHSHVQSIVLGDIHDAWRESPLLFALMSDEEFRQCTLQQLIEMNPTEAQMWMVRRRLQKMESSREISTPTISQIQTLKGENLKPILGLLSGWLILLLTEEQIRSVSESAFTTVQSEMLLRAGYRGYSENKQVIASLDLNHRCMSMERFKTIFDPPSLASALNGQQIVDLLNRGFCDLSILLALEKQLAEVDINQVDLKSVSVKEVLAVLLPGKVAMLTQENAFYPFQVYPKCLLERDIPSIDITHPGCTKEWFQNLLWHASSLNVQLTKKQLLDGLKRGFFQANNLHFIRDQLPQIDFKQLDVPKAGLEVMSFIFREHPRSQEIMGDEFGVLTPYLGTNALRRATPAQIQSLNADHLTAEVLERLIEVRHDGHLTAAQIIACLNRGVFNRQSASSFSSDKIGEIDFTQVDLEKAGGKEVISPLLNNHIHWLKKGETKLIPYIAPQKLMYVRSEFVSSLDFNDPLITPELFTKLIEGNWLNYLSSAQILASLNRGLFTADSVSKLGNRTRDLDFRQLEIPKVGLEVMSFIFRGATSAQIQSIDTDHFTAELLERLIEAHLDKYLTAAQIIACLNRGVFNPKSASTILSGQIGEIDFTQVDFVKAGGREVISPLLSKHVQELKKGVVKCISYIESERLQLARSEFVQSLDFNDPLITPELFTKLITEGRWYIYLSSAQILASLNRGLFTAETAPKLSSRIREIDFSQLEVPKVGMGVVSFIFREHPRSREIMGDEFGALTPYLSQTALQRVTKAQIQSLSVDHFTPDLMEGMMETNSLGYLSVSQLIACLNRGLFNRKRASSFYSDQIGEIDFAQIDFEKAGGREVISPLLNSHFHILKKGVVKSIFYIEEKRLQSVHSEFVSSLDFNDPLITPELFAKLILEEKWHKYLTPAQILASLNRGLFTAESVTTIGSKISGIDFSQVDFEKAGVSTVISALLKDNLSWVRRGLTHCIPHLPAELLTKFGGFQLQSFDFSEEATFSKESFRAIVGNRGNFEFSQKQLMDSLNRGLFDLATVKLLKESEIIYSIDYDSVKIDNLEKEVKDYLFSEEHIKFVNDRKRMFYFCFDRQRFEKLLSDPVMAARVQANRPDDPFTAAWSHLREKYPNALSSEVQQ